ncbi:MAG TPA: hypothetical protein DCW90_03280 [Lachnospiraceae bacterium]|nr:hypothetical protein [Lachnospiraceae bacterium]
MLNDISVFCAAFAIGYYIYYDVEFMKHSFAIHTGSKLRHRIMFCGGRIMLNLMLIIMIIKYGIIR